MTQTAEMQPAKRKGRPSNGRRLEILKSVTKTVQSHPEMSVQTIADTVGIAKSTAQAYLAKYGINKQDLDEFVENRVDIVRDKQRMILENLTPDKLQKAAARDLIVGYGILLDKDRLESGQSTSNISSWCAVVHQSMQAQVPDKTKGQ